MSEDSLRVRLAEAEQRIEKLERDNRRLRFALDSREDQIKNLVPGLYILTDDGDFNGGPGGDMKGTLRAVGDYTGEGAACTVIQVFQRYTPDDYDPDTENGVEAGIDYPWTLHRRSTWQDA